VPCICAQRAQVNEAGPDRDCGPAEPLPQTTYDEVRSLWILHARVILPAQTRRVQSKKHQSHD
jgi:hypothetical protein